MARSLEGRPAHGLATVLYQECVVILRMHFQQIKADSSWLQEQQEAIRHHFGQLILWGEDLCDGQLEACLARSSSLQISVLEVLSSLGAALIADSLLATQHLDVADETLILTMRSTLNDVHQLLMEVESDSVSTIPDTHSDGNETAVAPRQAFVEDVEHCVTLLFRIAPTIEAISDDWLVPNSQHIPKDIENDVNFSPSFIDDPHNEEVIGSATECVVCAKEHSEILPIWYCHPCDSLLCEECWDQQVSHKRRRISPEHSIWHEKADPVVAKKIALILEPENNAQKQALLHAADENALWFDIAQGSHNDYHLIEPARLTTIMEERSRRGGEAGYPALASFVGETGSGKSALIKLLIGLRAGQEEAPVPVVSAPSTVVPTSSGVHLYYDPCSIQEAVPILYADTEGLGGGERVPTGQTSSKWPGHRRDISWANNQIQRSREYFAQVFYPRVLYTFSDVIVCVLKNIHEAESIFQRLVDWAASAMEASSNQPVLPHAVIVLNAATHPGLWNVEASTRVLLEYVKRAVWDNPSLRKTAEKWRGLGRPIDSVESLLLCYYPSIRVIRIPAAGRPKLMYDQIQQLYAEIERAVTESHKTKRQLRMLLDSDQIQLYFQFAFDHFCRSLEMPFDFLQASVWGNQSAFGANIRKLAAKIMQASSKVLDGPDIFEPLEMLVASCIMVDAVRKRLLGTADDIFRIYETHLDGALESFCNYQWRCEFKDNRGQCVNTKFGHIKGHQRENGKILAAGQYLAKFSAKTYGNTFRSQTISHLRSMLERLLVQAGPEQTELDVAAIVHHDVVSLFYARIGGARKFFSNTTCLSCLVGVPEHILSCAHTLCTPCIKEFGIQDNETKSTFTLRCPLHRYETVSVDKLQISTKPNSAGPRVLALDGGGIRSIVQLTILSLLERELGGGLAVTSFFDLIVGTNTGGIIALGLGIMQWPVKECIQRFEWLCHQIFISERTSGLPGMGLLTLQTHQSRYRTAPLETALQSMFGQGALFGGAHPLPQSKALATKVAVTTTSTDGKPYLVANYNRPMDERGSPYRFYRAENPDNEIKIWEAARATFAAPLLFKPFVHKPTEKVFTDGAIYYNNPVEVADRECRLIWPENGKKPPDLLLSLGTGLNKDTHLVATTRPSRTGVMNRVQHLVKLATDHIQSSLNSEDTWMTYMGDKDSASDLAKHYARLNPELDRDPPKLDELQSLRGLKETTRSYFETKHDKIQQIADQLIASSFHFERTMDPVRQDEDQSLTLTGSILCRFEQGSEDIMRLGQALHQRMLYGSDPRFIIKTGGSSEEEIEMTRETVARMKTDGMFYLDEVTITVPRTDFETSINLNICGLSPNVWECPIGGFPRCVLNDAPGSRRFRPREQAPSTEPIATPQLSRRSSWASTGTTLIDPEESLAIQQFLGLSTEDASPEASPQLDPALTNAEPGGPSDLWSLQSASTVDLNENLDEMETQPEREARRLGDEGSGKEKWREGLERYSTASDLKFVDDSLGSDQDVGVAKHESSTGNEGEAVATQKLRDMKDHDQAIESGFLKPGLGL